MNSNMHTNPAAGKRYRVSILSRGQHQFTGSAIADVLTVHRDNTVTLRSVKSRYVPGAITNRVPLSWENGERVFTEVVS
jgi:hypothetical protein